MTPHETDLLQGLHLAEVDDGLGCHGACEAVGDVDLFQCRSLSLCLTVDEICKAVVTELLLRERLRAESDTEVDELMAVSAHQTHRVVVTEVVEGHVSQVGKPGQENSEVWFPIRLRQLKQETESLLQNRVTIGTTPT